MTCHARVSLVTGETLGGTSCYSKDLDYGDCDGPCYRSEVKEQLRGEKTVAKAELDQGTKKDAGKTFMSLVYRDFALPLRYVAKVGTMGAMKYSRGGWLSMTPDDMPRLEDAMFRHWDAYVGGEFTDDESKLPHLAHFAWNALALLYFALKTNGWGKV